MGSKAIHDGKKEGIGPTISTDSLQYSQDSVRVGALTLNNLEVRQPRPVHPPFPPPPPEERREDSHPIQVLMCVEDNETERLKCKGMKNVGKDEERRARKRLKR